MIVWTYYLFDNTIKSYGLATYARALQGGQNPRVDHHRAVKEYSRAAADQVVHLGLFAFCSCSTSIYSQRARLAVAGALLMKPSKSECDVYFCNITDAGCPPSSRDAQWSSVAVHNGLSSVQHRWYGNWGSVGRVVRVHVESDQGHT